MSPIVWLSERDPPDAFPPVERALREPDGLLAVGGDLSPERIVAAYRRGIFPWYSPGQPILWWSPDPRAVLYPRELRVTRSLRKSIRNRGYETSFDADFEQVIEACASEDLRPDGTWISPAMIYAYRQLHERGLAHSIEVWREGRLVGGLYGVALGQVFFGESMFTRERDASKVALAALCERMTATGGELIDCQMATSHLHSLGARLIPRRVFLGLIERYANAPASTWSAAETAGTSTPR